MSALTTKLRRDLWHTRGQAVAVAVVVACSVAASVSATATGKALLASRDGYYAAEALADVFAEAVRVPELVATRVAALPGVAEVETRVVGDARVEHAGGAGRARLLSLGTGGGEALFLVDGGRARLVRVEVAGRSGGLAALASGLEPGARVVIHPGDQVADGVRVRSR